MLKKIRPAVILIGLTLLIYFLTKSPLTQAFRIQFALLSLVATIFYIVVLKRKGGEFSQASGSAYLASTTVLFIVGATGWFFSPFFFSLYLLAVLYSFIFSPAISTAFVATLVILFSFNIGEVDVAYDFLVVLSLLTTIPICHYLRKEYLKLKEYEKKILILEAEHQNFADIVEKVLANKVVNFAVNLKQPINDAKQLAYEMKDQHDKKDLEKNRERIMMASDEALVLLKKFEEEVTGLKLLTNRGPKDISSPAQPADQDSDLSLSKKPSPPDPNLPE